MLNLTILSGILLYLVRVVDLIAAVRTRSKGIIPRCNSIFENFVINSLNDF